MKLAITSRSFSSNKQLVELAQNEFTEVKLNDGTQPLTSKELPVFLKDCQAAIVSLDLIDETLLKELNNLKFISKFGVGLDNIDQEALKRKNIQFYYPRGVNKRSVSELTLFFMLDAMRSITQSHHFVEKGQWEKAEGRLLTQKNIGIIGYGNIGQDLAKLLGPFDVNLRYYDIESNSNSLEEVLQLSDIVSLHIPLTPKNNHFFDEKMFKLMKKGSYLINTSRGNIVDELSLIEALKTKHLAGAYFDVLAIEPPQNNELCQLENFYLTPHIGGSAEESILAMGKAAIEGLKEMIGKNA